MGASRKDEPVDHQVLASAPVKGGYRMTCSCGWLSDVCRSAIDLFDVWADHVDPAVE